MSAAFSRYARAFADVLFEKNVNVQQALGELQAVAATVAGSPQLQKVWASPAILGAEKQKLLGAIAAKGGTSKYVQNFLAVLIDHGRIADLGHVVAQVEQEIADRLGLADAEIVSARALGEDEKQSLERQVAQLSGKQVRARYSQDASLLGGVVVKLGSTVYDGSVKGRLEKIRERLGAAV